MERNKRIFDLSLEEKIGQLFFPAAFIHDSEEGIREIEALIKNFGIGGLTFFYSRESVVTNFDAKKTFKEEANSLGKLRELVLRYQSISKRPLLISIDAEWGLGMRIPSIPSFPYPLTLAAISDLQMIKEVGKSIGEELKAMGIHQNLAPVVDVNTNPSNPVIGYRSFGDDPRKVTSYASAYYEGLHEAGILGCLKHFPGHGDTTVDSHLGLPVIKKELSKYEVEDIAPYRSLMGSSIDTIMVGHLAVPAISSKKEASTVSKAIVTDYLRGQLGFRGAVMTDALNMKSVSEQFEPGGVEFAALEAGCDLLSYTTAIDLAFDKILKEGDKNRIYDAVSNIFDLKERGNIFSANQEEAQWPDSKSLRKSLANHILTDLSTGNNPPISYWSPADTSVVVIDPKKNRHLFPGFLEDLGFTTHSIEDADGLANHIEQYEKDQKVLVALYPPSVKPLANFSMPDGLWNEIEILCKKFQVLFFHFGNPYSLSYLPLEEITKMICCYQALSEIEKSAYALLKNELKCVGQFPITKSKL